VSHLPQTKEKVADENSHGFFRILNSTLCHNFLNGISAVKQIINKKSILQKVFDGKLYDQKREIRILFYIFSLFC
jgi:hypothetical protein